jgi:hypothetical protein
VVQIATGSLSLPTDEEEEAVLNAAATEEEHGKLQNCGDVNAKKSERKVGIKFLMRFAVILNCNAVQIVSDTADFLE